MLYFLLWTAAPDDRLKAPQAVAKKFKDLFAPLLPQEPQVGTRSSGRTHLVYFEIPVTGWKPGFHQKDHRTEVWAPDFPLNAHTALHRRELSSDCRDVLPVLARALQDRPEQLLKSITPPMLVIWRDQFSGELHVINDALGHAQLYEYRHVGGLALSNRLMAFKALALPLTPVASEWAANCCLGWFPLDRTGFKEVRFAEPSTHYGWSRDGQVRQQRLAILDHWIKPPPLAERDCLELARAALVDYVKSTWPLFSEASGGLTGGFDSRAIFATYRFLNLPLRPRVKGPDNNYDVIVSKQLAGIAGLPLTVKSKAELPADSKETLKASIAAALMWQAGNMDNHKLISFAPPSGRLSPGSVNVMGHDGVIGRAFFARMISAGKLAPEDYRIRLTQWFSRKIPSYLKTDRRVEVERFIRRVCRQGADRGLSPARQLDFLYLYERTRRWSSGSQHSQTSLVLAPFLNHGFIRAVYSYGGSGMSDNLFHRHIIATHAPDWAAVPFDRDLKRLDNRKQAASQTEPAPVSWRRSNNHTYFNRRGFWQQSGRSLLNEALGKGAFWKEIYDPRMLSDSAPLIGDELTMLYVLESVL